MIRLHGKGVEHLIGDNIRNYRKINNMSQEELAEKLDVTRQSVSLWESGQTQPSLDNIIALSKIFGVPTDDLLTSKNADVPVGKSAEPDAAATDAFGVSESEDGGGAKNKKLLWICLICAVAAVAAAALIILLSAPKKPVEAVSASGAGSSYAEPAFAENSSEQDRDGSVSSDPQTGTPIGAGDHSGSSGNTQTQSGAGAETRPGGNGGTQSGASADPGGSRTDSSSEQRSDKKDLYGYLKNFVIQNGKTKGDMTAYSKSADNYGGYASDDFTLWYWGDTDTVEFCLHTVIDDTYSINVYIRVPKTYSGQYVYISSYYYRDSGDAVYEAKGSIDAAEFTSNYPLKCTSYIGPSEDQDWFMELSRQGVCEALKLLKGFTKTEHLDYSFADFGFRKF